jgi:hypothetical protein
VARPEGGGSRTQTPNATAGSGQSHPSHANNQSLPDRRAEDSSTALTGEPSPLTSAEARELTEAIRENVVTTSELLLEAHDRQAWRVLGYRSWSEYLATEFDVSRSHSYRLLDQARVMGELREATGDDELSLSTREASALRPDMSEVVPRVRERVERGEDAETVAKDEARKRSGTSSPYPQIPPPSVAQKALTDFETTAGTVANFAGTLLDLVRGPHRSVILGHAQVVEWRSMIVETRANLARLLDVIDAERGQ